MVKADAYGHGAVPITRALKHAGVCRFGVATVDEGAQLRSAGIDDPILVVGALVPSDLRGLFEYRLTPVIYDLDMARELASLTPAALRPYPIHVKVDTGMGRLGLDPAQLPVLFKEADWARRWVLEGLMTHLADADNTDPSYTTHQLSLFTDALDRLAALGIKPPLVHVANSAGIIKHPATHFSLVRPGIMLYGYHTLPHGNVGVDLRPVLTWQSTVAMIRDVPAGGSVSYNRTFTARRRSRIAVLPVGYADGYDRHLSNAGVVLMHGRRVPVVGRVCMDMTLVDVTDLPEAAPGDPVVLLGSQGSAAVTACDIAQTLQTIPYEVLCAIGPRVPRLYHSLTTRP